MSRRRFRFDTPPPHGGQNTAAWDASRPDVITLLEESEIDSCGLIPWGSNYTFLITVQHPEAGCSYAVYKPQRGESPLYDFPEGTLYRRERAAYVVSSALGWDLVPPTVIRDGPYGIGMVQLFVEADTNAHYFTFGPEIPDAARRIALFDLIVNNTDRKAGHLLRGHDGRVWAIDHGLTFHSSPKLRTVIWDFAGDRLDGTDAADLERLVERGLPDELTAHLQDGEAAALERRISRLLSVGRLPEPRSDRPYPWPLV